MVGSAICRRLRASGYTNLLTRTRAELDLLDQGAVYRFLAEERPDYVFVAAAKVGGIQANNTYRADFIYQNLAIETNLIHGAHLAGVQHLMLLGSSCIYPRDCPQPMREDFLLTGLLEPTNEPYAIAKIAGVKLCEAYRDQYARSYMSVLPTNLYGPNDNFNPETSHVLPALIHKAHVVKLERRRELVVWGSGTPKREFLFVEDLAHACGMLLERQFARAPLPSLMNVGCGEDLSVHELAELVIEIVGADAAVRLDPSKPDGTPRKLLDSSRIRALGWTPRTPLREGIRLCYQDYLSRYAA